MTIPLSSLIYQSIHMYVTIFVCNIYIQIHISDTSHCKYILAQYITLYNYMIILYIYYIYICAIYICYIIYYDYSRYRQISNSQNPTPRGDQLPPGAALSAFAALRQVLGGPLGGGGPSEVQRCHENHGGKMVETLGEHLVFLGRCYMYVINMLRYVYRILEFVQIRL